MASPQAHSVKQCDIDPDHAWLRALLARDSKAPAPDATQRAWCADEGLAPLIAARIGGDAVELAAAAQQLAMRELAHHQALRRLAESCATHALDVMVIKGEALARTLYAEPATRARSDIDLWVRPAQLDLLRDLLVALGWPAVSAIRQRFARFEIVHGRAAPPSVAFDVHVHPFFRPRLLAERPFDAVWADAEELAPIAPLRAPCMFDATLIAALHLAKNRHRRAIWLYDLDRLCTLHPAAVMRACAVAPGWRIATLLADALARSARMFGTALPCALPQPSDPEPSASLLADPPRWRALWRDLQLLPDWHARTIFLRELFTRP
jgi:hypothetical protein